MGKKRRIVKHPQKFGRKFAAHPRVNASREETGALATDYEPIENPYKEAISEVEEEEMMPKEKAETTTKKATKKTTKK